jgi:glutathione-specific gamma-glutamylcyclotransferase
MFKHRRQSERYDAGVSPNPWIFGYGSLVWRPGFPYQQRRPGFIRGYTRRFWQASTDHRGTPDAPGRVVTLLEDPDAVCWGVAYEVATEHVNDVLLTLDHREKDGYERIYTRAVLTAHQREPQTEVDVLVYIASADNPSFLGPAPVEEIAGIVRVRHGPSGSNLDYVLRLAEALFDIGAEDPHVFKLARLLEV